MAEGHNDESGWNASDNEDKTAAAPRDAPAVFKSKSDEKGHQDGPRGGDSAPRQRFDRGGEPRRRESDRERAPYADDGYRSAGRRPSRFEDRGESRYEGRGESRFDDRGDSRYDSRRSDDRYPSRYDDRPSYRGEERSSGRFDDHPRRFDDRRDDYPPKRQYNDADHYRGGRDDYEPRRGRDDYDQPRRYRDDYDQPRGRDAPDSYRERRSMDDGAREKRPRTRQDEAAPNETLGIFSLSYDISPREFDEFLASKLEEFRGTYSTKLIVDRMTGRCKGYGFVTFNNIEDSTRAKELLLGSEVGGALIRVAFSVGERRTNGNPRRDDAPRRDEAPRGEEAPRNDEAPRGDDN
ncbi:hypothetical protein PAPHI01_0658 [Pancytospora philotis]|nr:hypothetical protein PAPHI01_0658 [Pancytospora philotis]